MIAYVAHLISGQLEECCWGHGALPEVYAQFQGQ